MRTQPGTVEVRERGCAGLPPGAVFTRVTVRLTARACGIWANRMAGGRSSRARHQQSRTQTAQRDFVPLGCLRWSVIHLEHDDDIRGQRALTAAVAVVEGERIGAIRVGVAVVPVPTSFRPDENVRFGFPVQAEGQCGEASPIAGCSGPTLGVTDESPFRMNDARGSAKIVFEPPRFPA